MQLVVVMAMWLLLSQTVSVLNPQTLSTIPPSTGQNNRYGNILLYETSMFIVKMANHDGNNRCLTEKNVPTALILPSRWPDGAESLGIEHQLFMLLSIGQLFSVLLIVISQVLKTTTALQSLELLIFNQVQHSTMAEYAIQKLCLDGKKLLTKLRL